LEQDCCSPTSLASPHSLGHYPDDIAAEWDILRRSISENELEGLEQLRQALEDCDVHPACSSQPFSQQPQTLLRFLRARDGNVPKAARMFRDMLNWRQEFQVEEKVAQWNKEMEMQSTQRAVLVARYGADVELCVDRYGIPVRLIRLSVCDAGGAAREFGKETCLVDTVAKLEHTHRELRRAMFRHEKLIRGQVQIIDAGDYGKHGVPQWAARMWASFQHGPELYRVLDLNYPETVRTVFFVRTGPVTNSIWRLALPLIPPRTKKKLKLFGQQAKDWNADLLKELPHEPEVPRFLLSDSEEAFAEATPKGGIIPPGISGPDFGNWSVLSPPSPEAFVAEPGKASASKAQPLAARGFWPLLLAVLAVLFAASLGGSVAWPMDNNAMT